MKNTISLVVATFCLARNVVAHYVFNKVDLAGVAGAEFEGIRPNTNGNSPVTDLASTGLRCNEGGLDGSATTVREMQAGDEFTFHSDIAVYHQGPISIFLSQAPDSVQEYEGDGLWAKVVDLGPTFTSSGATWSLSQTYTFNLPTCIPDGEYLLRIQSLAIHNPYPAGIPQFYSSCAQIRVTGGSGTDSWNPTLNIPGAFHEDDPGYVVNIYDPSFTSYEAPGGEAMTC